MSTSNTFRPICAIMIAMLSVVSVFPSRESALVTSAIFSFILFNAASRLVRNAR